MRHLRFVHDFRRLRVWKDSRILAVELTIATRAFPREDRGVLTLQLRKCALSVPANISEGCGKSYRKESIRYLEIACASAFETETHLLMARELRYLPRSVADRFIDRLEAIQRGIRNLINNFPE